MQKQVWLYQKRGRSVYLRDENMMHCVVVWKTKISGFIHLSYKFTLVILGIRWSADLTDSENIYSIKKESTYILWRRGSWNRCCCCSVTKLCLTLCDPMNCSTPGFPVLYYLLEFAQTHFHWLVMPSNHLILCHLLLLLPSIFPSIRVFSNESALFIWWPKYWSFSFSISPSSEYSGLISFRIDWFDLAVQGTLRSLLEHHSSKETVL